MLPAKYNLIFAAWQKRFAAWEKGERPPPYPTRIITQIGLARILQDPHRYHEGMAIWTEDVTIRGYLQDSNWQILYRSNTPLHRGFDFVSKYVPTGQIVITEMKMSNKVGKLRTYLRMTKTKGRQMSLRWVRETAKEIGKHHPLAYQEIMKAMRNNLLKRRLIVANHNKKPRGWLSASMGKMGMRGFFENDFKNTPGFD